MEDFINRSYTKKELGLISITSGNRDKMFRYRMVSHAIAHLINRDFVSLHRDSESAQNHLPSWRKISP